MVVMKSTVLQYRYFFTVWYILLLLLAVVSHTVPAGTTTTTSSRGGTVCTVDIKNNASTGKTLAVQK